MGVTLRIIQQYSVKDEKEFWSLEKQFVELEKRRPEYARGKRLQPISAGEPNNTLIWQGEFPDLMAARQFLELCGEDEEHEVLFVKQAPYINSVRVEFYENIEFD